MQFKIWKTIKLGTGQNFYNALLGRYVVEERAREILRKFSVAAEETELDLVRVTVGELDFQQCVRRDQLYERAKEFGLELCPAEVGPQLRLQYQNQPDKEFVLVAMEPILDFEGQPQVFRVERAGSKMVLRTKRSDFGWYTDNLCVFCLPRK